MLQNLLSRVFGTTKERSVRRLKPLLDAVRSHEARLVAMSNDELRLQTRFFKARLAAGETLDDLLPEAFATAREAAKRTIGMRPYDVQILGGIVLHQRGIAEMVTGEGKTLVATMPLYLNALTGKGVHLITVNDYLARRDGAWMGPIFEFLGMTLGVIQHDMSHQEKQTAYRADVTYGTNSEFGFDYLRDNMALRPEQRVQRKLNFAIIDEVDSILIDEARTPLIISGMPEKSTDLYYKVDAVTKRMKKGVHYESEEKGHHILLTEEGMEFAEKQLGYDDLYTDDTLGVVHMVEQSLKSHNFYRKDDEYVVKDGQVNIVDEFTGRIMEGRRYSDGLHQAIEAKEGVAVQFEMQTIASITYQNFFRLYTKIAGMTGTAMTEASEFAEIYDLDVVQVPTNLPMAREDLNDLVFGSESGKFNFVVQEIVRVHESGRPVLVGTVSIEKSERVGKLLEEKGIEGFEILNAKHHEREAAIVANAGKRGAITIATNMAGRGTDIKLAEGVRELGGLYIMGTERHESRRIDNQLRGRCGRQGDPGTTRFYVSLEDEVARLFGGDRAKRLLTMFGGDQMDEQPLDQRMVSRSIERAQRQVEEYNFETRKYVVKYDAVMNKQRQVVYGMRNDVMENREVRDQILEMFESLVVTAVDEYAPEDTDPNEWDLEGLESRLKVTIGFAPDLTNKDEESEPKPLAEEVYDAVVAEYARRESLIADEYRRAFKEQVGADDAKVDFEKLARNQLHHFEKRSILEQVDEKWRIHLYTMDNLKETVRLRAYGQRDPLVEYQTEGFELFDEMMTRIYEGVVQTLFRITDPEVRKNREIAVKREAPAAAPAAPETRNYSYTGADKEQDSSFAAYDRSKFDLAGQPAAARAGNGEARKAAGQKPVTVRRDAPKVKPNDPCPCGSGKKYKKCCGAND